MNPVCQRHMLLVLVLRCCSLVSRARVQQRAWCAQLSLLLIVTPLGLFVWSGVQQRFEDIDFDLINSLKEDDDDDD